MLPRMSETWQRRVALGLAFGAFAVASVALIIAIERRGGDAPATPASARAPAPPPTKLDLASGVRRLDATHVEITRAAFEALLADPSQLAARAEQVPGGFRVLAIARGSVLDRAGLHDGDVIRGVDGMDVSTPATALEVYQQLRSANRLTIDLDRGGEPVQISVAIR